MTSSAVLCACGCGSPTRLSDRTDPRRGVVRGFPLRFITGHNNHLKKPADHYVVEDRGHGSACWIFTGKVGLNGYGYIRRELAHRAYYERAHGAIPVALCLDHLCRVTRCVNPDHLEPVTNAENCRRGAKAKLTKADVVAIRSSSASHSVMAAQFGVSSVHVSKIRSRQRWAGTAEPEASGGRAC